MADAQFAIDIAAEMPAGEVTLNQLDALTAKLTGAGRNADVFQKAIVQSSAALDAAAAASKSANAALAEGETEYRRLERAALQSSKAAEKAAKNNEGVIPEDLAQRALASSQAVDEYAKSLRKLENNASDATGAQAKFTKQLKNVRRLSGRVNDRLGESATNIANLRGALGDIGGPAGELGGLLLKPVQGFTDLAEVMGKSRAAAIVAGVAVAGLTLALAALVAIAVIATGALAALGVGLANNARNLNLAREAAEAFNPKLKALSGTIGQLERSTNLSEEALRKLSTRLIDAKVSASELPAALRAAALAEAALGKGGSASFIANIKAGRLEVGKFANDAQQKFGGIVARQMLGLGAQTTTLKRNLSELFGGLNINPVLEGVRILVSLFDSTTAAGKTMKFLFESVFQPLIDQAENAALVIEAFALGFLIGLTKVFIAIKPAIKAVTEFFGFEDTSLSDILAGATDAGEIIAFVFVGFVAILGLFAAAVLTVVAVLGLMVAGLVSALAFVFNLAVAIHTALFEALTAAVTFLISVDWSGIGSDLIEGLASGITGAAGFVVKAVTRAVQGAINAAKSLLGISSPSKVFAGIGENTGEGFTNGVEDTEDQAQGAMLRLVEPPPAVVPEVPNLAAPSPAVVPAALRLVEPPAAVMPELPSLASLTEAFPVPMSALQSLGASDGEREAPSGSGPVSGSGASLNLSGAQFIFNGVEGAEGAEQRFKEALTQLLEGDATQLGADEAAA